MLISTKGRYALRLLTDLAEHQSDGYVSKKRRTGGISIFSESELPRHSVSASTA